MSGLYAADGSMNVTVVSGLSFTGLYAADGSINVIISPGSSFVGAYHPCGAWYVTVSPGTLVPIRAPDGSLYVQTSPYTGNSGKKVTAVSGSLNQAIGGYKIGDAGMAGTIYENHILSWGDDFNSALDIVGPSTPKGKYFVQKSYSAGPRGNTTTLGLSYDTDPLHTGYQDSNRGVPIGYTNMSQSGSILKLGARKATSGEQAGMSPTDPSINSGVRPLLSSMMHTDGTVGFYVGSDASVIVEAYLKYTGNSQSGWHPDFWVQTANPLSSFVTGSFDSLNACEGNSTEGNSSDLHIVNGTTTGIITGSAFTDLYDGNFHLISMVLINGGSWLVYIDGVLKTTLTTDANSFSLPMYILATSHVYNATWFSENYSAAAWNTTGASLQIDYIRVWRPSTAVHIKPLQTIPDLLVSYTGTGSIVLPSAASMWSTPPDSEYVQAVPCEVNEPGMGVSTIYQQFPSGVTYNSGTRTINVDFSAGTGNAGVIHGTVKGWKTGGSMTYEPVRFTIIRGPATSTISVTAVNGTPLSIDAYPQVDVGIATPKTIAVSSLATGLSYNSTNNLITGTPSGLGGIGSSVATVTCTNSQGQSGIASLVTGSTLILSQNWDGVTAPTLPAGWTAVGASGLMTTSIVVANSSPNSIKVPPVLANAFLLSPSQDTNSGNVSVSSNVYVTNTTATCTIGVVARGANLTPTNYYRGVISRGTGSTFSAAIQKNVSGTTTTLVSLAAGSLFANAAWYNVILTCVGTSLSLSVQRMSDSMWLNSSSTYQSGQTTCLTVTDSSITGAGYYGLYGFSPASGLNYLDDFSISTAS